jgi:hypothetical protein
VSAEDVFDALERHTAAAYRYDRLVSVRLPAAPTPGTLSGLPTDLQDQNSLCDASWPRIVERRVASLLLRALGNRVTAIRVLPAVADGAAGCGDARVWGHPESLTWACDEPPACTTHVWVALRLQPEHWSRVVDRGPPAASREEALAFRAFWGEVSELRRFPDGAIVEAIGEPPLLGVLFSLSCVCNRAGVACAVPPWSQTGRWHFRSAGMCCTRLSCTHCSDIVE